MEKGYAVITGASSGIGAEFAKRLAKEGYPLVLVARRGKRLQELAETLETECVIMTADLSDMAQCERLVRELPPGKVEILINNAGFGACGETLDIANETELSMIDVNIKALHLLTKLILKEMVSRDEGYILNVASSAGLLPAGAFMTTYYATKAYVTSFTRGIAEELRRKKSKVYVGCLCPGPVNTEFNRVANVEFALPGIGAAYCANYAVNQMRKRKVTIIPTFQIKVLSVLSRLIPTRLCVKLVARQQRRKKKE